LVNHVKYINDRLVYNKKRLRFTPIITQLDSICTEVSKILDSDNTITLTFKDILDPKQVLENLATSLNWSTSHIALENPKIKKAAKEIYKTVRKCTAPPSLEDIEALQDKLSSYQTELQGVFTLSIGHENVLSVFHAAQEALAAIKPHIPVIPPPSKEKAASPPISPNPPSLTDNNTTTIDSSLHQAIKKLQTENTALEELTDILNKMNTLDKKEHVETAKANLQKWKSEHPALSEKLFPAKLPNVITPRPSNDQATTKEAIKNNINTIQARCDHMKARNQAHIQSLSRKIEKQKHKNKQHESPLTPTITSVTQPAATKPQNPTGIQSNQRHNSNVAKQQGNGSLKPLFEKDSSSYSDYTGGWLNHAGNAQRVLEMIKRVIRQLPNSEISRKIRDLMKNRGDFDKIEYLNDPSKLGKLDQIITDYLNSSSQKSHSRSKKCCEILRNILKEEVAGMNPKKWKEWQQKQEQKTTKNDTPSSPTPPQFRPGSS
ncbi:MAG: hypothetical protein KF702_10595, partial [Gammaproteobacteria bacterium]|nr:hypothetical protein [Gammaproteobacteria bacterium]